jgi:hypothetical protein
MLGSSGRVAGKSETVVKQGLRRSELKLHSEALHFLQRDFWPEITSG